MSDWERFITAALEDGALRERLLTETDTGTFIAMVVGLARQRGLAVSEAEVRLELEAAARSWTARQVR